MPATIALLRGVNVGGHNKVPMAALRTALAERGYPSVRTYVQSGNIVVHERTPAARYAADVRAVVAESFGCDVPVVVRAAHQLATVAAENPFAGPGRDPGRQLLVGFLDGTPDQARVAAIDPHRSPPDELRVRGAEVYFWCPDGWGRSKVSVGLEKALGTAMTVRNWRTVTTLLEMANGT